MAWRFDQWREGVLDNMIGSGLADKFCGDGYSQSATVPSRRYVFVLRDQADWVNRWECYGVVDY